MASFTSNDSHPKVVNYIQIARNEDEGNSVDEGLVKNIDLSNVGLTEFPLSLLYRWREQIELINLGGNQISSLPDDIQEFTSLKILFFASNEFTQIPSVLGRLPKLSMLSFKSNKIGYIPEDSLAPTIKWLILTDNNIQELPISVGKLSELRKCMLAGNKLRYLPDTMKNCTDIELIRLADNQLLLDNQSNQLLDWLLSLPKLTWIALASNQIAQDSGDRLYSDARKLLVLDWEDLEVLELLGEGASGHVYKARIKKDQQDHLIAVKVYKGAITSDGKPTDELAVHKHLLYTTNQNPNIDNEKNTKTVMKMIGEVINHPHHQQVAIFPLLDLSKYSVFGLPPSFSSITRDCFPMNYHFYNLRYIKQILLDIAHACEYLRSAGVVHGDIYAHNILLQFEQVFNGRDSDDNSPVAILSDFGASWIISETLSAVGGQEFLAHVEVRLEEVEVRAYGCFLDDVLARVHESIMSDLRYSQIIAILSTLRDDCLRDINNNDDDDNCTSRRPKFQTIVERLEAIEVIIN